MVDEHASTTIPPPTAWRTPEELLVYLPGAPLGELPQEFRGWVGTAMRPRG
ncbi:MAG: hypothetical protein ACLRWQ_21910 [Flavonifractor plautii]